MCMKNGEDRSDAILHALGQGVWSIDEFLHINLEVVPYRNGMFKSGDERAVYEYYNRGVEIAAIHGVRHEGRYRNDEIDIVFADDGNPFVCSRLADLVSVVAFISTELEADDSAHWARVAGDAQSMCHFCEETGSYTYDPGLAFQFYLIAGEHQDAQRVASQLGEITLLYLTNPQAYLNYPCVQDIGREYVGFDDDLVIQDAVGWLLLSGKTPEEISLILRRLSDLAFRQGRVDSALKMIEWIPEPRSITPEISGHGSLQDRSAGTWL